MLTNILLRRVLGALVSCVLALVSWLLLIPAAPVAAGSTYFVGATGDSITTTNCTSAANTTCTLRGAISLAISGTDTITFNSTGQGTITLTSATTLTLSHSVTIDGSGHTVVVDGGCTFVNTGCNPGGVAVFAVNSGITVTLKNLTIQHGNSSDKGGGIANNGGTLTVIGCTVTANEALHEGGGIENTGTLTVTNSTLTSNNGQNFGGGIANHGPLTVTNSTLTDNHAVNGGGIFNDVGILLTLTNTIVTGNSGSTGPDISGTVSTPDHNLLDNTSGETGISNGDAHGDIVTVRPLLGTLGSNGGTTPTIPLLAGSPAIGAGDASATGCASTGASGVNEKDQRGFGRSAARCAIGSFEPQQGTYTVGSVSDSGATANFAACQDVANATCKLRDALAYAASGGDTVQFNGTGRGTITLQSATLTLATSVSIFGPTSGGAVTVDGGCGSNCTFCPPGGVTVFTVNGGVTASLSNLTIQHGNTTNAGGGIVNNGTLTVTNSTITANCASGSAGGFENLGTLTVMNSTITANHSSGGNGGGGFDNQGTLTLTNSTLSGNIAGQGGGILNFNIVTVINSTLSGNTAFDGGGIVNDGTATLTNTIVAANSARTSGPDLLHSFTSGGHNLIGKTDGSTGWIASDLTGTVASPRNPLLGTLRYNGGPTQTIALLPGSPAIDAGDDAVCAQTGAGKVNSVDQRGVTRPVGLHCDIGAYETQPGSPNPLPPPQPTAPIVMNTPAPLPGSRPSVPTSGQAPNPLPVPRP